MAGEAVTDADGPGPEALEGQDRGPRRSPHPRWPRRTSLGPLRGRWAVILPVVGVLVGGAVIDGLFPVSSAAPVPATGDGVLVAPPDARSASAFCPAGTGTAANTTIYLTNSTSRSVSGAMTSIGQAPSSGTVPTVRRSVVVPPLGTVAVNPAGGLPPGSTSSSFTFTGGGVAVSQVVGGPNGWSTAPCATQPSSRWAFAGGSTMPGYALTLSLFNPAASDASVNISFFTSSGLITPQAYQGLTVPAGQMVAENVGDFVQNSSDIATLVTAQSGTVVSTEFQQLSSGSSGGLSLRLGAPALSTVWRFAQTTNTSGSTVTFYLANPTSAPVTATIAFGLSSGSVEPRHLVVGPLSESAFVASGTTGVPQQVPYSVTVTASAPIVAGRSIQAASTAPQFGSSSGTVTAADRWLVPGPGVPEAPGTTGATVESLAVANPGPSVAMVTVAVLGGAHPVSMFAVASGAVAVLGPKQVGGLPVLTVSSSQPVNVEEDSGPTGAPGVVSSTGFPFVG